MRNKKSKKKPLTKASEDNNINQKTLSSVIKNKTFTVGFYWKFES